ncbi:UDP-2-acetamido-3-amino-2,3-dideoxy-glucuronate N-acetyltransferase [Kitasatospora sp. MAA19]|uniref:acyltransferase n=1 Tax=Kitasatospora sp. MAA19 TaxID=3035090 RepID=UPI002476A2E4|nr:acyltransferase [Kitasatospora sp. MAA19]MDH6711047.1 UDP-2-acetamido-3-amino-2,3-dideoxy-glucuronate N-acetyltransferase [Kitasatospora sp. MAA19]
MGTAEGGPGAARIEPSTDVDGRAAVGAGTTVWHLAQVREDGVFIGPAAVLTNDRHPRAVTPDGRPKRQQDWHAEGVTLRQGCSIGGRAVLVAGVTVGRWALVAAGAVVHRDVPDFALVAGVPARRIGWVGRAGEPLEPAGDGRWHCPRTGEHYRETGGTLAPG